MSSPPTPEQVAQASITLTGPIVFFIGAYLGYSLLNSITILPQVVQIYVTIVIQLSAIFFITHAIWGTLILNFGIVSVVTHVPWSAPLALLTTGICAFNSYITGQLISMYPIFSHITGSNVLFLDRDLLADYRRIYTLSGGATKGGPVLIAFVGVAIMISTMQLSACSAFNVKFYLINRNFELLPSLNKISEVWLASAVVGDWINGVTFVVIMRRERKNSAFPLTKALLDRIIINFVESGLITATLALADLIVFLVLPATTVRVTLEFILGPLYANVMMANLNSREKMGQAARALEMDNLTSGSYGSQSRPAVQIIENSHTFSTSVGHSTDMGRVRLDTSVIHHRDDGVLYNSETNLDAKIASLA
ncbi:hypothetical protein F5876DRAFT_81348 [Lentinula aff. lateritia]|uniref:Uncharacterized protein n=1 Tax=Lentinula aff. lateritia TaxID=2804960 RepID=A0ACC1TMM0_9AGAR|nr:hypothetical protein F5876DRAFT_81348 [Lentinula aff. lateritia]